MERGFRRLLITRVEVVAPARFEIKQLLSLNFMLDSTDMLQPLTSVEPALKEFRAALAALGNSLGKVTTI